MRMETVYNPKSGRNHLSSQHVTHREAQLPWMGSPTIQSLSPEEVHSIQCGVRLGTCTLGPSNRVTHPLGTSYKQRLSWAIASIHIHVKS
jgi:hypothetical protein